MVVQFQKYALLLLCCEGVLHHVPFNQYWVAHMAFQTIHTYTDRSVNLMAVGILSILAAKLTCEQTAKLGSNPLYMSELLKIVRKRIETKNADITLQFTLSALWNLTDESPLTCEIFLNQSGMYLFIRLLNTFHDNTAVQTKALGLFNNVAEVPSLRKELLQPNFITMLKNQLQSKCIAVSYFAAGITAHLICSEKDVWISYPLLQYDDLIDELVRSYFITYSISKRIIQYFKLK